MGILLSHNSQFSSPMTLLGRVLWYVVQLLSLIPHTQRNVLFSLPHFHPEYISDWLLSGRQSLRKVFQKLICPWNEKWAQHPLHSDPSSSSSQAAYISQCSLAMGIGDPLPIPHSFDSCCCLACALQGGSIPLCTTQDGLMAELGRGGSVSTPHSCLQKTICHEDMDTFNLLKVTTSHPYPDWGRWKSLFLVKRNSHNLGVYSQACACLQHMCAKWVAALEIYSLF